MRYLWSLRAVPLPDVSFLALQGLTLLVYLALSDREVVFFGTPATALQLTVAFFVMSSLARNVIFGPSLSRGFWPATISILIVAAAGFALFAAIGFASAFAFKMAMTAWVMTHALVLVIVARFDDEDRAKFPLIWASSPDYGREACLLTALGYTLRGGTLAGLAFVASDIAWVAFLTLGWVILGFLTNWVIVMMIMTKLDAQD
ncbi:MAG: hypothetical protein AAFN59_07670 [Pseudomonadota bacterium]